MAVIMAFCLSFTRKVARSVSATGAKGSKVLAELNESSLLEILGKSIPLDPNKIDLKWKKEVNYKK